MGGLDYLGVGVFGNRFDLLLIIVFGGGLFGMFQFGLTLENILVCT